MDVMAWLLDSDPAIRWQVMRDLQDAPAQQVAAERARVATEGWGARLLAMRDPDGQWAGGACFPGQFDWTTLSEDNQPWTSTLPVLDVMCLLGLDPDSPQAREMAEQVRDNSRWEYAGQRFFDGEVEPCINGRTVAIGATFGQDVDGIVERLLGEQLDDGGWNCEAERGSVRSSFNTTICVLEGLLAYEQKGGRSEQVKPARKRAEEYLLERRLFRRLSTGDVADEAFVQFSFPPRWHYDVLRGLDYFRSTGVRPEARLTEAVELVVSKRQPDGRWLLENTHGGDVPFVLEGPDGTPSRWNTLRALRVLRWADGR